MHSKSVNIEIMVNDKADKFIEKHFESLLNNYQIRLETSVSGSDFVFYCIINVIKHILKEVNYI